MRALGARGVWLLGILVALGTLSSCGADAPPADLSDSEAVSFKASDGVRLEGRLFGAGASAVVLSHMRPADQRSWFAFAKSLADEGYLVLTYDFRGYCPGGDGGCSEGERDIGAIWRDVLGAIDLVRSRGATRIALIGASMGGTASLVAAAEMPVDVVVTLSAPTSIEGLVADAGVLTRIGAAKLFLAGVGDAPAAAAAQTLYEQAPPPKRVEILPADDHGSDLVSGSQGGVIRRMIETYLAQFLAG